MQKIKQLEEKKYCLYCGNELIRKRYNGRLEDFTIFTKRKYCDSECMAKHWLLTKESVNSTWRTAHQTAFDINKKILRIHYCEKCYKQNCKLDVHHKDENWRNNNLENLQVLCRGCHTKIHRTQKYCIICGKKENAGYNYCNKHYIKYKKYGCPLYYGFDKKCKNCTMAKRKKDICMKETVKDIELES